MTNGKKKRHTKESILTEVMAFFEKNGRSPLARECHDGLKGNEKVFSFGMRSLGRHFGTLNKMLETAGLPTNTSPRPPVEMKCDWCSQSFLKYVSEIEKSKNHFCSSSCAAQYNNKNRPRRVKPQKCRWCDASFFEWNRIEGKRKRSCLCEKCRPLYKAGCRMVDGELRNYPEMTIKEFKSLPNIKNLSTANKQSRVRGFGKSWNKDLLDKYESCPNCGYKKHLELAHIVNIADFHEETNLKVIHAESNMVPLCPNCHWEFDYDDLELQNFQDKLLHPVKAAYTASS